MERAALSKQRADAYARMVAFFAVIQTAFFALVYLLVR